MANQKVFAGLAVVLLATLAACGGGGGSTPVPAVSPAEPASPMASTPATVVTTPGTVSYINGSEESQAFSLLNKERAQCGFGLLTQSNELDAAAKAHADYQLINKLNSHLEDPSAYPNGFTGVTPGNRIVAAGYTDYRSVTDEYVLFSDPSKAGRGAEALRALLNAPYHMAGLLAGFRDVGIAVRSAADVGVSRAATFAQLDLAYKASTGPQQLASADVKTYPCEGSQGVNRQLTNESPSPVPGRDLAASPLGTSVYIGVREGQTLRITSASMIKVATGGAVTLRTPVSSANDPQAACSSGCLQKNQAYVSPDAPLEANTAYQVTVSGTNEASAFSRTFTFTTGTGG